MKLIISKQTIRFLIKIEGSTILMMLIPVALMQTGLDIRSIVHITLISLFTYLYVAAYLCLDFNRDFNGVDYVDKF